MQAEGSASVPCRQFAQKNGAFIFQPVTYFAFMRILLVLMFLAGPWLSAGAAPATTPVTVQGALKLLTKDEAKNLVRIEAREGNPAPERWYFQVYDPASANGLREIVVWQKTIVASRALSQFLEEAKPEDVVGARMLRIDSDDLIKITQQYVEANNIDVAKINYTMFRDASATPVWKLACLDEAGKKVAEIVVNARTAAVISHEGFQRIPGQAPGPAATPAPIAPASTPQPAATPPAAVAVETPAPVPTAAPVMTPVSTPAEEGVDSPSPTPVVVARASPVATPTPKRGLLQRIFGGGKPATPKPH